MRSDHESLKWLYSLKEPKHRIARWIGSSQSLTLSWSTDQGENTATQMLCPDVLILGSVHVMWW